MTDFQAESIKSVGNVFLGRRGRTAGETCSLELSHASRGAMQSGGALRQLRESLIAGDVMLRLPDALPTGGGDFYCWADGTLPPPVLAGSMTWSARLPLRYYAGD